MSTLQPYNQTQWVNGGPPAINSENLLKIEKGIADVTKHVIGLDDDVTQKIAELQEETINENNPESLAYKIIEITNATNEFIDTNGNKIDSLERKVVKNENDIKALSDNVNTNTSSISGLSERLSEAEKNIESVINNGGGGGSVDISDAETLDGHDSTYFATASSVSTLRTDYNNLMSRVETLEENSSSGGETTIVELEWKTF